MICYTPAEVARRWKCSAKRGSAAQQARQEAAGKVPVIGVADGTIRTELNQLRAALLWAEKRRMIARAPAIEMPQAPTMRERHPTRLEFEALPSTVYPNASLAVSWANIVRPSVRSPS